LKNDQKIEMGDKKKPNRGKKSGFKIRGPTLHFSFKKSK